MDESKISPVEVLTSTARAVANRTILYLILDNQRDSGDRVTAVPPTHTSQRGSVLSKKPCNEIYDTGIIIIKTRSD